MTALQSFSKPEDVASTTDVMLSGYYHYLQFVKYSPCLNHSVQLHQRCLLRHSRSIPLCQPPTARTAPTIDAAKVLATGASEIQRVFSGDDLVAVLNAYIVGIKDVFAFSLAGAAFTVLIALAIPFKKLPSHEKMGTEEKEKALVDSDPRDSESTTRVARLVVLALVRVGVAYQFPVQPRNFVIIDFLNL
jgi:hypothetical protein